VSVREFHLSTTLLLIENFLTSNLDEMTEVEENKNVVFFTVCRILRYCWKLLFHFCVVIETLDINNRDLRNRNFISVRILKKNSYLVQNKFGLVRFEIL